ncbi:MAG: hypothetical protein QXN63_05275 [Candidatus Bathyarchaeia archaeon]
MDVEIVPTKKLVVFGIDKRGIDDLVWCASTFGINRLFWIDGYILCLEVYEKSFDHEIKKREFPISQLCYTSFPKYVKVYEVEKGVQIPIVNVSNTRLYSSLIKAVLKNEPQNEQ